MGMIYAREVFQSVRFLALFQLLNLVLVVVARLDRIAHLKSFGLGARSSEQAASVAAGSMESTRLSKS